MAGEISNHGHNMVSELTRTDWCFFSPQRPLNGAVLTLVHYSRCTPLPGCRPSCWCTIMPVPCGLACALWALCLCPVCPVPVTHLRRKSVKNHTTQSRRGSPTAHTDTTKAKIHIKQFSLMLFLSCSNNLHQKRNKNQFAIVVKY